MVRWTSNDDSCFLWINGPFLLLPPWCPVLQLPWIQPPCTRASQQDSSFRNTTPQRQVSLKAMIHPQPKWTDHTTQYWHRHGRHFNWSLSCCNSNLERSSSSFRRHTLCSSYSHHSGSHCPLANKCPHHHLCHNTPKRQSHPILHSPLLLPHYSHHYATDWTKSCSSNSHHTAWETQLKREAKPHPKPSIPHTSHHSKMSWTRTGHQILPQIQTMTLIL